MNKYALWQFGNRGPELVVLHGYKTLMEFERRNKLCDPVEISAEHEDKSLDELAVLYPVAKSESAEVKL